MHAFTICSNLKHAKLTNAKIKLRSGAEQLYKKKVVSIS